MATHKEGHQYPKAFHVVNNSENSCGHKHKTPETAEKCHDKLLNFSKDGKTCSAEWYNSKIVSMGEGYNYNNGTF